ncbi:MAG: hypothetical protein CME64_15155 [Halobacteriovoraceae bacterium]|nr:hypothetical protein [Halobacteriovoraceae bacterium]|tara:strand:+ start:72688 stop:73437 length:750 start_codon:yes stop_codon:yes gene_type:complete
MSKAGNNSLKKNFSAWAIFSIVSNTKINAKPVLCWRIVNGQKKTVEGFFRVIRKFRNEIVLRATANDSQRELGKLVAGCETMNFFLPEDMVLFQTQVKSVDQNGDLVIAIPKMIAQVDRRKHMRLNLGGEVSAIARFQKENHGQIKRKHVFEKSCYDISGGGLSFIVSKTESKFFKIGDEVGPISVNVENKDVPLKGKVLSILEIEPNEHNDLHYKGYKICIQYSKIGSKAQKFLEEFVFRHIDLDEAG